MHHKSYGAYVPKRATMPGMKSPAERGPVGAWAEEARDAADLSVPQVIASLAAKGHGVTDATIRGIEGGSKKPGRKLLRLLGEVYGSRPPGQPEEAPPGDMAALVRELRELAEAIREERQARVDWETGLLEALRELGAKPPAAEPSHDLEPAPHGGAGR